MATAKYQNLEKQYQQLLSEYNILKCKVECKTDALLILSHEQEQCRSERDQYRLMADQLRERYSALKKRVEGWGPSLLGAYDMPGWKGKREQGLVQLLCELKEQNKSLQCEVDDLTQKLSDAHGDVKILRDEITRSRTNSMSDDSSAKNTVGDREKLVMHLEKFRHKCFQLEQDLQTMLDEKEELIMARDAFRLKYERLNQQLNCLLRGDQHTYVDIDGVIMENRYLQERIKQVLEEKSMAVSALAKCRALLEKKRAGSSFKLSSIVAGLAVSAKQVEQLLQKNHFLEKATDSSCSNDLRNLILTLLEALSDNAIALSHQKKTNKILGTRVSELEQKLKSTEAASLWQFHDSSRLMYLHNLSKSDDSLSCENGTEQPVSPSSASVPLSSSTPVPSEKDFEDQVLSINKDDEFSRDFVKENRVESSFSDLDLLPTKDINLTGYSDQVSSSSVSALLPSPSHHSGKTHSANISPTKRVYRANSFASLQVSPASMRKERLSSLDVDDLPPKLQKLLIAALSDLDKDSCEKSNNSPHHVTYNAVKTIDPSC